jgi:ABC-2 type transport system permease protein
MFSTIFKQEITFWLKQVSTYIYLIAFLAVAILLMAGTAGFFDEAIQSAEPAEFVNSPSGIFLGIDFFNRFILFLLPTIIGLSVYRDYKSNMHNLLYSYPFTKKDYLVAKFTSSFCITSLIVMMIGLGMAIGTIIPGVDKSQIAPFNPIAYLQVYAIYIIPNLFLFGSIVFVVVALTRNIYAGFITIIILFFIQQLSQSIFAGLESKF